MAIGFPPKYFKDIPLGDLTREQGLVLAIDVAEKLEWNITHKSVNGFIAHRRFRLLSTEVLKVVIDDASIHIKSQSAGNVIMDLGRNESNVTSFIETLESNKSSADMSGLAMKYEELRPTFASCEDDEVTKPSPGFLSLFVPRKGFFVTPILIYINIILFVIMVFNGVNVLDPDSVSLLKWGANFRPLTIDGQWWRLLTCIFLHIGVFHLLLNMYALVYIGLLLEPYLGRAKFLSAYLLTGLASSMASLYWHENTLSAGASGAIFGMYGVFVAMLTTNNINKVVRQAILPSILIFVVLNLMNGVKSGIDNAAHIGGLVSGIAIGYLYYFSIKQPDNKILRYASIAIAAAIIMILSIEINLLIPKDILIYQKKAQKFDDNEKKALLLYSMPVSSTNLAYQAEIVKDITYYNENMSLVTEMDKLNVPSKFHLKDSLLIDYCNLRIHILQMMYEQMSGVYKIGIKDSAQVYRQRVEDIMQEIKSITN